MADPIDSALAGEPTSGLWSVTLHDSAALLAEHGHMSRRKAIGVIGSALAGDTEPFAALGSELSLDGFNSVTGRAAAVAAHVGTMTGRWR